jgi:hypothetical protein
VSELDRVKEQLVYLRFWLGILVATGITLVGWLISTPMNANLPLWLTAASAAPLIAVGIVFIHRRIERRIDQVGKL